MKSRSALIVAFVCAVAAVGSGAPAPAPVADPAPGMEGLPAEVALPSGEAANLSPKDHGPEDLTAVVIPEHVHLVDKRSPHKKFGGYGGYGGYGGGHRRGGYGGGCNVCGGGGGYYPRGGGGYGGGGSYSQSSSSSQSSSGSWGKRK